MYWPLAPLSSVFRRYGHFVVFVPWVSVEQDLTCKYLFLGQVVGLWSSLLLAGLVVGKDGWMVVVMRAEYVG